MSHHKILTCGTFFQITLSKKGEFVESLIPALLNHPCDYSIIQLIFLQSAILFHWVLFVSTFP